MIFKTRIICCILLILVNGTTDITATGKIEGISAEVKLYKHTLQLKIRWNTTLPKDNNLDVIIKNSKKDEYCPETPCAVYGISKDLDEIILPRDPMPYIEHKECSIKPGCTYNITVMTNNRNSSKSMTYKIPECVEDICSCKHDSSLPKPQISAEMLSTSSIRVNWTISIVNISQITMTGGDVVLDGIYIRINQHNNPSLSWGGMTSTVKSLYSNFNSTGAIVKNGTIKGNNIFTMKSTILPDMKFQIFAHVVDNFYCRGSEAHFFLIVPSIKNDLHGSSKSFHSIFISIIVPAVLLILAGVCVAHYIYKSLKKSSSTSNWMSIYRSTIPGNTAPISMEENLLYREKDVLEIPHNSIIIGSEIGKGAFGRVFGGVVHNLFCMSGKTIVAVKELKARSSPGAIEEFLREIETMKNVGRHENVVELLGYCTIKEPLLIVMKYVRYGNLLKYLRIVRSKHLAATKQAVSERRQETTRLNGVILPQVKYLELKHSTMSSIVSSDNSYIIQPGAPTIIVRPSITETVYTMLSQESNPSSRRSTSTLDYVLDNKELHNFAVQIAKGMRHLEEKGITHRDLAARNVLIDEGKILKISDFGLSRPGIYINTKSTEVPFRWLSLEAIRDNLYSSKSDVWAFAVVLWEIGTLGGFPYPTINNYELRSFLTLGNRLDKPEICSDVLYKLMMNCWEEEPDKRPSFKEIVNRLQPQNQKIYVEFSSLGQDYVFPPTKEQLLNSGMKSSDIDNVK